MAEVVISFWHNGQPITSSWSNYGPEIVKLLFWTGSFEILAKTLFIPYLSHHETVPQSVHSRCEWNINHISETTQVKSCEDAGWLSPRVTLFTCLTSNTATAACFFTCFSLKGLDSPVGYTAFVPNAV